MLNPLLQFFEVEEREDGVYIKVPRTLKGVVRMEVIENKLKEAMVTNYNLDAIQDVFTRARGVFERVGSDFEYYDEKFDTYFSIKIPNNMTATVRISSEATAKGFRPTENLVLYALTRRGVKYGINKAIIKTMIDTALYDKEQVVAEGLQPEAGIDGIVENVVDLNPSMTPSVDKSGKTNYRDIKSFVPVKKSDLLARKIPPKQGKPGRSIFNEEIKSTFGGDIQLPAGKNTELSADGLSLLSTKDGIVFFQDGKIHVRELLNIGKDVDFSVGNIKYAGDVYIKGNVKPGFVIETEGNIEIHGEVESSKIISRKGFVTIAKGVIGKNETEIFGEKGISVAFAQDAVLRTEGVLVVDKHLLHCRCICLKFEGNRSSSSIIGGSMIVYESIDCATVGNESHVKTEIFLVDRNKQKALEKIKEMEDVKEKVLKQLEPISKELKTKNSILKKSGAEVTERQKNEMKKWIDSYNNLNLKIKYIDQKIADLHKEMDAASYTGGHMKVHSIIHPSVRIDMYGIANRIIDDPISNKLFRIRGSSIQAEE